MPVGGAAQLALESAVLRAQVCIAASLPDVGRCQRDDDGDDAEPAQVGCDHAQHDHHQDGAAEQLVESVHSLVEHCICSLPFELHPLGTSQGI